MTAPSSAIGALPLLSLFCGPGGLDLGFEQTRLFRPLLALDHSKAAVETYNANRPGEGLARQYDLSRDAREVVALWNSQAADAGVAPGPMGVIGGPPCQAFSLANVRKFDDDPRARLPLNYAAILEALSSEWQVEFFLFENVAGIKASRHSDSLSEFKRRFKDAGFDGVEEFELDAVDYGVPQHRRRVFIAGVRSGSGLEFAKPQESQERPRTVHDAIGSLPDPVFFKRGINPAETGVHPNHWCMNPRSKRFHDGSLKPGDRRGRSLRVLNWNEPSMTVAYGHREVHVHPNMDRRLSVFEAMLLQGFPESYELKGSLSDQIRQVSDAVPPPLASALATAFASMLGLEIDHA